MLSKGLPPPPWRMAHAWSLRAFSRHPMAEFGVDWEAELEKVEKSVDIVVSERADNDMVSVATDVCLLLSFSLSSQSPSAVFLL